jgi:peptide/nickel transport system permease protein
MVFCSPRPRCIPQYIVAEVVLSFLGLGVSEPSASWGTMFGSLQQYHVLASYLVDADTGLRLDPLFAAYYTLADAMRP